MFISSYLKINPEEVPLVHCQLLCIGDESSNNQPGVISHHRSLSHVTSVPCYSVLPRPVAIMWASVNKHHRAQLQPDQSGSIAPKSLFWVFLSLHDFLRQNCIQYLYQPKRLRSHLYHCQKLFSWRKSRENQSQIFSAKTQRNPHVFMKKIFKMTKILSIFSISQ